MRNIGLPWSLGYLSDFHQHQLSSPWKITLLRVIPTMAFNSSHPTFYLANLLAFYLAFYLAYLLAFYMSYLLTFDLAYLLTFYLAYLLTFHLAYLLTFYLTFYLAFFLAFGILYGFVPGEAHGAQNLAGWGPARPHCSESRRLRSGEAHMQRALSRAEVRRGPLRSRAGRGGPARATPIESWQRRSGEAARKDARRRRRRRRRRAGWHKI